jgi:dihydrofolate reductase
MRIVISEFISLDGIVQAPGGPDEDTDGGFAHGGWSHPFFDPEVMGGSIGEAMATAEALLFGRRTWQTMAAAWPERAGDPFADQMNAIKKYVVSRTLSPDDVAARWNNTELLGAGGDAIDAIGALRAAGGDRAIQIWGSTSLVRQLVERDLVDEYRLFVYPLVLGAGTPFLPSLDARLALRLVETRTFRSQVTYLRYERARAR